MTSLLAFIASDGEPASPCPASLYFVSDSRRSWDDGTYIDDCQKLYASGISPEIYGLTGDVALASSIIKSHMALVATESIAFDSDIRFAALCKLANSKTANRTDFPKDGFTILYGIRLGKGKAGAQFRIFKLHCDGRGQQTTTVMSIDRNLGSSMLLSDGTGAGNIDRVNANWRSAAESKEFPAYPIPSRDLFRQFCESIEGGDWRSGGAPQLVVLHRSGNAEYVGIFTDSAYLFGKKRLQGGLLPKQWRNMDFEVCDSKGQRTCGSQRHVRPSYAPAQPARIGKNQVR